MQQQYPPHPQQQPYPPGQYPPQPQYPMQPAPQYPPGQYPPQHPAAPAPAQSRGCAKDFAIGLIAVIAAVYVVWPSIFPDFVPDIVPVIGQIDDDTAVLVILSCLRYFGIDLTNLFNGFRMLRGQRR
jgi:hypothetical protein